MSREPLHIAFLYNMFGDATCEDEMDRGSTADLLEMVDNNIKTLEKLGHRVSRLPLAEDLDGFIRRLRQLNPDVVFNQYDEAIYGGLNEMRVISLIKMFGYPVTGSSDLALGLCKYKHLTCHLLAGAGIPIPPCTVLIEHPKELDRHDWLFPLIVQPSREHGGEGIERDSVVDDFKGLRRQVGHVLKTYQQPALVQHFLSGREFNVSIIGGNRLRVLPLAEVNYAQLPAHVPPIMSYAAKCLEGSIEYEVIHIDCPAKVEKKLAASIRDVALRAFRAVGGRGYGRIDIRLDQNNVPRVLDVNCNPCLDEGMGLARSASRARISYPRLLQMILDIALEKPTFAADTVAFAVKGG
ncbi:MAG: hypothetical protein KatS3mg105_3673 [Gemmatales bacterium]|nr:MAG: hypothetical protein KatS3mg105_3673 [Gemmatales bacterium]